MLREYCEVSGELSHTHQEVLPGEVIFLLISKMPTVFETDPLENVMERSEPLFHYPVCWLDVGLNGNLF